MTRPRILHIGPCPACQGGITAVIRAYFGSSLAETYDLRWLTTFDDRNRLAKSMAFLRAAVVGVFAIAAADLVHIHTSSRTSFVRKAYFLFLCKLFGKRAILHIHGGAFARFYASLPPRRQRLMRRFLTVADRCICLSETKARELAVCLEGLPVTIIPNPSPRVPGYERCYTRPDVTVLFAGLIAREKGVFDLLEAFSQAAPRLPTLRLVIAGNGRIEECQRLLAERALAERVSFPGWLRGERLQEAYRGADIFCLPSYVEGLPMVILEAMAHGLPIVCTPVGGIPDAVRDGREAVHVEPGDAGQLAAALETVAGDPERRGVLGLAAKKRATECFGMEAVAAKIASVYDDLLRRERRPGPPGTDLPVKDDES